MVARPLRFGVHTVQENCGYPELAAFWRHAEAVGYDWISVIDHLVPVWCDPEGPIFEAVSLIAALAASTERVRIGTLTLCNNFRHPGVLARALATIDHIANGRLEPGIGAGWNRLEHAALGLAFPSPAERVRRLEESLQIIKLLWTERRANFAGRYYTLADALGAPPLQKPRPPLWVGGSGEQLMLKVVARHADGWNPGQHLPPDEYRRRAEILARNCAAIGRDPAEIRRSLAKVVVCAETDARAEELLQHLEAGIARPLDREQNIVGGPDTCLRRLLPYAQHGVTEFIVRMPVRPIGAQLIENFMALVAPRLREAVS